MQTKNPLLDDLAQLMTNALGAAQGVSEEARTMMRAQAERFVADMDLVRRDEFEAMTEMARAAQADAEHARAEIDALRARLDALQARLDQSA